MLLTYILFLLIVTIKAQNIVNSSLESSCVGNGFINPTCVKNWYASSGYPIVAGESNGNKWALLSSFTNKIEGIYSNYNFKVGETYRISFKIKVATNNKSSLVSIKATSGLNYSNESSEKNTSQKSELIWNKDITKSTNNWETITFKYSPETNNTQIWIFPSVTSNNSTTNEHYSKIEIDDIEVSNTDKDANKKAAIASTEKTETKKKTVKSEYIFPEEISKGDYLNVRVSAKTVSEVHIIDLAGNIFKTSFTVLNDNYIKLQVSSRLILEGTYVVKVIKNDNTSFTNKLKVI